MQTPAGPLIRRLSPRDPGEVGRVSTNLELLTDLCFVVAVSQAAGQLHHYVAGGDISHGVIGFLMAFFAIWWTWLNFTWFASAYDNDDVLYRLLTILQIVGSLVIAAGVPAMFTGRLRLVLLGYIVMRIALVTQWLRAARNDPERAVACRRYAVGFTIAQLCWVSTLVIPAGVIPLVFPIFVLIELAVPAWAEHAARTPWHPHHVAERYGLFYIIVLGEVIFSTLTSLQQAFRSADPRQVLIVAAAGVGIVFSLWWLYFARSAGIHLQARSSGLHSFAWGYGHYLIFAATAAIGAGLDARIDFWRRHDIGATASASLITISVAVLLAMIWFVHLRFYDSSRRTTIPFAAAIALVLIATLLPVAELIVAGVVVALLIIEIPLAGLATVED
ncbi:MAG: low temperature requirement protein A [Microlunatus sp.]|nr:low temperature requirement protein A [Microlunatus sp.]